MPKKTAPHILISIPIGWFICYEHMRIKEAAKAIH